MTNVSRIHASFDGELPDPVGFEDIKSSASLVESPACNRIILFMEVFSANLTVEDMERFGQGYIEFCHESDSSRKKSSYVNEAKILVDHAFSEKRINQFQRNAWERTFEELVISSLLEESAVATPEK